VLEDVYPEDGDGQGETGADSVVDVGPAEQPGQKKTTARAEPIITGAGRVRSLNANQNPGAATDWENVGRNDPCPCGSGKKFKKCHGVTA
jgi:preprotein translocase subunit SecA